MTTEKETYLQHRTPVVGLDSRVTPIRRVQQRFLSYKHRWRTTTCWFNKMFPTLQGEGKKLPTTDLRGRRNGGVGGVKVTRNALKCSRQRCEGRDLHSVRAVSASTFSLENQFIGTLINTRVVIIFIWIVFVCDL